MNASQEYTSLYIQHTPTNTDTFSTFSREHIELLQNIKDKAFITSILCSKSCAFFSWIRTLINIPLILSSGAMTILNSMNDINTIEIKYANIILNSCTVTILSLVGNFKLAERELSFRQAQIKMDKLYHHIEDKLLIDPSNCSIGDVRDIIKEYVIIYEHLDYPIPEFIRKNCKVGTKTPPLVNVDLALYKNYNNNNAMMYSTDTNPTHSYPTHSYPIVMYPYPTPSYPSYQPDTDTNTRIANNAGHYCRA
jgi:hypothetical protein